MLNTSTMQRSAFPPFMHSVLTGAFTGIVATIICLFYNVAFRSAAFFNPAILINVSTIIFGVNILFVIIGVLHYYAGKWFSKGEWIYSIAMVLVTLFCIWRTGFAQRDPDALVSRHFKQLLDGVILISGACAAVVLPWLYHSKKFEDEVLGEPQI
jgi:hypothetical protein